MTEQLHSITGEVQRPNRSQQRSISRTRQRGSTPSARWSARCGRQTVRQGAVAASRGRLRPPVHARVDGAAGEGPPDWGDAGGVGPGGAGGEGWDGVGGGGVADLHVEEYSLPVDGVV